MVGGGIDTQVGADLGVESGPPGGDGDVCGDDRGYPSCRLAPLSVTSSLRRATVTAGVSRLRV